MKCEEVWNAAPGQGAAGVPPHLKDVSSGHIGHIGYTGHTGPTGNRLPTFIEYY